MHHQTVEGGKGGSVLLSFFLFFPSWGVAAATPQGFISLLLWYFFPVTPPDPHPQGFSCFLQFDHPSQLATFSYRMGVLWWIYKAHTGSGMGCEMHSDTLRMAVRDEGGEEQATVKLIRTSCICFTQSLFPPTPPLYLWNALMCLSAWKCNEKCIIAIPLTVPPPSRSSSPLFSPSLYLDAASSQRSCWFTFKNYVLDLQQHFHIKIDFQSSTSDVRLCFHPV